MPEPGAGLAQLSDPYVAGVTFTQGLAEGDFGARFSTVTSRGSI
jgi:hypothetical protein